MSLPPKPEPLLRVQNLVKHFPVKGGLFSRQVDKVHAVDGVSFDIAAGETLGVVGESGCGKSTLVRLINRLLDPTSGSIRLAGTELADMRARAFAGNPNRARIQMVFQDAGDSLNPRYTAADAIADPDRRARIDPTALREPPCVPRGSRAAGAADAQPRRGALRRATGS